MQHRLSERILLSNNQMIAVNKRAGEPSQQDKTASKSLKKKVQDYCRHPVHIVNRLDRPSSGVVLFAKNATAMDSLSSLFREGLAEKYYLSAVSGFDGPPAGEMSDRLKKDARANKSRISDEEEGGKNALTLFRHIARTDNYDLLLLRPVTGRHHQLRAQLAHRGWHIKGDVKYGARRSNKKGGIHLHAWRLIVYHPVSGERVDLQAPLPEGPVWSVIEGGLADLADYDKLKQQFEK